MTTPDTSSNVTAIGKYQRELVSNKNADPNDRKPIQWDERFIVKTLPTWVYRDFSEPKTPNECKALISATKYTIADIDLQIEIKKAELERRPNTAAREEFMRWHSGALRAKQTNMYLQSAYSYWQILNTDDEWCIESKLRRVIEILTEEPEDFMEQLEELL